jgi:hypothetical protein
VVHRRQLRQWRAWPRGHLLPCPLRLWRPHRHANGALKLELGTGDVSWRPRRHRHAGSRSRAVGATKHVKLSSRRHGLAVVAPPPPLWVASTAFATAVIACAHNLSTDAPPLLILPARAT